MPKAIICKEHGDADSLVFETFESQVVGKTMAKVAVEASGVNFLDTLIIRGQYQLKPPMPFSPGVEVAGTVTEVGEKVSNVKVGDRVMAFVMYGGYTEEIVLPALQLVPIPEQMSFVDAAAFPVVYGTAMHALTQRANLQPNEKLLVLGASGGTGMATVQIGKLIGATVYAAGGSDEKLAAAAEVGADECINYSNENIKERIKALTANQGVDVVFDAVGGDYFDQALRALSWEGRLLVVGFAAGRIPEPPINLLLLKSASLMGVFWGQFAQRDPAANAQNFQQLFKWYLQGQLKPHTHATYPLAKAADALKSIEQREVVGKLVLTRE